MVKSENPFNEGVFPYQFGINLRGRECGFGHPVIATKISGYIDWVDEIIFGSGVSNDKLEVVEQCDLPKSGAKGECRKSSQCLHIVELVKRGLATITEYICDFQDKYDPVICCPTI